MSDSPDRAGGFIEELRRRHVFRVAIAYAVVAGFWRVMFEEPMDP